MWYLSPFACLYDLLQFGFGHLNGLDNKSDEAGRDSVVLARGVCPFALIPAADVEGAAATVRKTDEAGAGDATRDDAGVLFGVLLALLLSNKAAGAHVEREAY